MSFKLSVGSLVENKNWKSAIMGLKSYLDSINYAGIYKYIASVNYYSFTPSVFSCRTAEISSFFGSSAKAHGILLAKCLTTHSVCPVSELTKEETDLAYSLAEIGLLKMNSSNVIPYDFQLISVNNRYLLIDSAIHFTADRVHEIYIGPDSLLILYYLNTRRHGKYRALDMCSGSGILGLSMTDFADVTVTDISNAALNLQAVNAVLNNAEDRITILKEDISETLGKSETFDVITCNPPFVAFPEGMSGPLYADGVSSDGLKYLRLLLEKSPDKLNDGGEGLFVADLPGDVSKPHFFVELESYAYSKGLLIDAYIDGCIPASLQIPSIVSFLGYMYPEQPPEHLRVRVEYMVKEILKAQYYYMTTIRITKSSRTGLRVFNRYAAMRDNQAYGCDYFLRSVKK